MKLIVGLGNPGPQYEKTRHNAGFLVVDRLLRRHAPPGEVFKARFHSACMEATIRNERCLLLKPTTYMNLSGRAVAEAVGFYKLDPSRDLLVIVDESQLPLGNIRIRPSGSAGGHNGLTDIERGLGSDAYPRLRLGIDAAPPMMRLEDYVLGRFTAEQWAVIDPALTLAADAAEAFVEKGTEKAMNLFNTKKPAKPAEPGPDKTGT